MRKLLPLLLITLIALSAGSVVDARETTPFDLQAAIDAAGPGSVLEIPPGIYAGAIVVDNPLHLVGLTGPNGERAVIDGEGKGSVLTITASGTVVENLLIRNSGNVIDKEDAGIVVEQAEDVHLIGNRLEDVLYGVRAEQAHRLLLQGNYITGKDLDVARRGDGLRLWQSENCRVEGNTVERVRDVLFWFSDGTTVRDNVFRFNRYGVHMMYTDGMSVIGNTLSHNSVGAYLMYSINVLVQGNTFQNNRGPSGYGLALKDMDAVTALDNYFIDNRVGLFFDNSPARVDIKQRIERNVLAYNDAGVLMMPAVQRNVLQNNTFLDNLDQVGVKGGGSQQGDQLGGNRWDGNFWSDYAGYDEGGDGVGDLPYRAESLFENLADRHQNLQIFHFSPVEQAIDLAARAFPVIKPKPKLTDAAPLMDPALPSVSPLVEQTASRMGWLAAGLLAGAVGLFGSEIRKLMLRLKAGDWRLEIHRPAPNLSRPPSVILRSLRRGIFRYLEREIPRFTRNDNKRPLRSTESQISNLQSHRVLPVSKNGFEATTMITVKNLTKRYPRPGRPWWSDATITAVDDLSFRLERGQALALWGINGAGKTTVLKCLLGLLSCEGELHLDGYNLRRDGRTARRSLGYVPQELAFHNDLSVSETCRFYARLKDVPADRIPVVLAQVGLAEQTQKAVGALSGGMKQRLALALALLADPPLLLLDEPTSNLDAATRDEFIDLLVQLRQAGKSLLFTSHHVEEVERLADQVLILKDGQLAARGTPVELMAHLAPERQRLIGHIKVVVTAGQRSRAEQVLFDAGYPISPNGKGLWVEVQPERKAAPLNLLYTADIDVIDVEI